jgi:hypothetical protein
MSSRQPIEAACSLLAGVDVQRLLDFLDHQPERFTSVVHTNATGAFAYYLANYLVDDELRSNALVIEPEFANVLRILASAFTGPEEA